MPGPRGLGVPSGHLNNNSTSNLRQLSPCEPKNSDLNVIIIPGVGTLKPDEWGLLKDEWQQELRSLGVGLCFWAFDYEIDSRSNTSQSGWSRLLEIGSTLGDNLQRLCDAESKTAPKPIVFACHGLGGFVLKQALHKLHIGAAQRDPSGTECLDRTVGIVFIAVPHGRRSDHRTSFTEACAALVRTRTGLRQGAFMRRRSKLDWSCTTELWSLCRRFDDLCADIHILSVFETQPSRPRHEATYRPSEAVPLVSRNLAQIEGSREELVGLHSGHHNSCHLWSTEKEPHPSIKSWLQTTIKRASSRMQERLAIYNASPLSLATTLASLSMQPQDPMIGINKSQALERYLNPQSELSMDTIGSRLVPQISHGVKDTVDQSMIDSLSQNSSFFGRETTLREMASILCAEDENEVPRQHTTPKSVVLFGDAGHGKTELALQFVFTMKDRFDVVWWIRAEDEVKMDIDFRQLAVRLRLQGSTQAQDPSTTRKAVYSWLLNPQRLDTDPETDGRSPHAKWLLVFDSADQADLLRDCRNIRGPGAILVTSRDPQTRNVFRPSTSIDVEKFTPQEGLAFLESQTAKPTTSTSARNACETIVKFYDGHPLALAQIAGIIDHDYLSYSDVLKCIDNEGERKQLLDHSYGLGLLARGSVPKIVEVGISKLAADSRELLYQLSFLDPDRIQEFIASPKGFTSQYKAARAQLLQCSLIRRSEKEDKEDLWMHRVVQEMVRDSLSEAETIRIVGKLIGLLAQLWPLVPVSKRLSSKDWILGDSLVPHVEMLLSQYDANRSCWSSDVHSNMALLLHQVAWLHWEMGNFNKVKGYPKRVQLICREHMGDNHKMQQELLSRSYDVLGCVANGSNDASGSMSNTIELLKLREAIREASGNIDEYLAYAYNQLGIAHMMASEEQKALGLFERSIDLWRCLPTYRPGVASMEYSNLGTAHLLLGDVDAAEKVLLKALALREQGFGPNDTESFRSGRILYHVGNLYTVQNKLRDGEEYHRRAYLVWRATVGPNHHRTADAAHKLGEHCLRGVAGDSDDRLDLGLGFVDQALGAWSADATRYAQEIIRTTFLKAALKIRKGLGEEAETLRDEAYQAYRCLLPNPALPKDDLIKDRSKLDSLVTFWSR